MRSVAILALSASLLALAACRSGDKDDEGEIGLPVEDDTGEADCDQDGDGFGDCGGSAAEDCDDTDASVYPGASEVCDEVDNDCDGEVDEEVQATFYADADSDGYGDEAEAVEACEAPAGYRPEGGDCDDGDFTVYPGAAERCDGLDNDCDGEVDEEVQDTWYADTDGDGFGDVDSPIDSCDPPEGYTDDATDCDDASAGSYPGAEEVCDGADNDCDGEADEEAVDAPTWYSDGDGDGYGDPDSATESCEQPSGTVADPGASGSFDCDDTSAAANPGEDEVCDEVDNDCDGDVDEEATDAATWYVDVDGDGYGSDAFTTEDCEQPTGFEATADDCNDGDADINPDATELCDGVDNDCDGDTDEDGTPDGDTYYADADSDGFGDASSSVTACEEPLGYTDDDSDCDDTDDTVYPDSTETETPGDGVDQDCDGLDACTDLDCDGIPDLFVGNHYSGSSYSADQQIFLGDGSDFDSTADVTLAGAGTWYTEVEDVDDDGYKDLLVVNYYDGSSRYIDSYLYWGSSTGYSSGNREDLQTYGALRAEIADLDLDGYQDIAFAQYYPGSYSGSSYVYYGSSKGYSSGSMDSLATVGAREVRSGDFDADGYPDLVFCNYYDGSAHSIDSYVYYGSVSGFSTSNRGDIETEGCFRTKVQDLDSDGYDDVIFANYYETGVGYSTSSYIYWGASSGLSESNRTDLPTVGSLDAVTGDFDGDGHTDIAFGSFYTGSSYSGSAYIYYGSSTGYSTADSETVSTSGTYNIGTADLDNDGYDDLVLPSYYDGSYTTGAYVHYGSSTGFGGTPTSLDTYGSSEVSIGDLDQDGFPELVFNNYFSGSWSTLADSYIYWGSSGGYTESNRTDIETYGSWPAVQLVGDTDW